MLWFLRSRQISHQLWVGLFSGILLLASLVLPACSSGQDNPDAGIDAWDGRDGSDIDHGDGADDTVMEIISIQPTQGPVQGGTRVTISGKGFVEGSSVSFGANDSTDEQFLSSYQLQATTPASAAPGAVTVVVRTPGGKTATLPNGFSYVDSETPTIGWCILQSPSSTSSRKSEFTEDIYGRAFVKDCSEGDRACGQLVAQLGFGLQGIDPSVNPSQWSWMDAAYNPGHTDDDNDEFQAKILTQDEGAFSYTYRFSVDEGGSWTYCDLDGTDNGFQPDMLGQLTVTGDQGNLVGWCNIQYPASTSTVPGVPTELIYGQVFVENCTEGEGSCALLSAELGWGPKGQDPFGDPDPSPFTWIAAEYNPANTSNNDEFSASVTPQVSGEFSYAFRFTTDGGENWAYCDLDGTDNGLQVEQMGTLTVQTHDIGWCNLQYPASMSVSADTDSDPIYGRVFVEKCSEGENFCRGILGQVGYGMPGIDPLSSPDSFTWVDAQYNPGHTDDNNDEYAALLHPMSSGDLRYVMRFSGDAGSSWTYCDLDGSENGFSEDQMGVLEVSSR